MVVWLLDTLQKIAILGPLFDTRVVYANASFTPQVLRNEFGSGAPCWNIHPGDDVSRVKHISVDVSPHSSYCDTFLCVYHILEGKSWTVSVIVKKKESRKKFPNFFNECYNTDKVFIFY